MLYVLIVAALFIARWVPWWVQRCLGRFFGFVGYVCFPKLRRNAQARLQRAFGHDTAVTARDVFETLAVDVVQTACILARPKSPCSLMCVSPQTKALLDELLRDGTGVVWVTPHLGTMDLMALSVAALGYPVATIARESYDPRLTRLLERLRAAKGVETLHRGRSELEVVRALKSGKLVGFASDLTGRGVQAREVDYLGRESLIALGPVRLAKRLGCALVVGAAVPTDGAHLERCCKGLFDQYMVDVQPIALVGENGPRSECELVRSVACQMQKAVEKMVAHWPWMAS